MGKEKKRKKKVGKEKDSWKRVTKKKRKNYGMENIQRLNNKNERN